MLTGAFALVRLALFAMCSGMTGLGRRVDPSSVPSVSVFALSVTGKAQECSAQLVISYAGSAFL